MLVKFLHREHEPKVRDGFALIPQNKKPDRHQSVGFLFFNLAEPPDLLAYKKANKVDYPPEGDTNDEKNNSNNKCYVVLFIKTLHYTVYPPYDIERRNTEKKLY